MTRKFFLIAIKYQTIGFLFWIFFLSPEIVLFMHFSFLVWYFADVTHNDLGTSHMFKLILLENLEFYYNLFAISVSLYLNQQWQLFPVHTLTSLTKYWFITAQTENCNYESSAKVSFYHTYVNRICWKIKKIPYYFSLMCLNIWQVYKMIR